MEKIVIDGVEIECEEIYSCYMLSSHRVNDISPLRTMLVFVRGNMAKLLLKELIEKNEQTISYLGGEYRCFVENESLLQFSESCLKNRYGGITFIEIR